MKLKPKGRKIYRQKTRFERIRTFQQNTGAVLSTLLVIGVLVFVGYSAGGPILHFLQERQILTKSGTTDIQAETATVPEEEDTIMTTVSTEAQETEPPVTEDFTESIPETPEFRGYMLPVSVLSKEDTLQNALQAIPSDATHILIPLKTAGGNLYYATGLKDAAKSGAVQAAMPLEKMYELVKARGVEPVAVLNTLEDNIYPANFQDAAYRIAGSGESWMNAGKPVLSPFSALTVDYMTNLAAEIEQAGFTSIVCQGLTFPEFTPADLEKLDPRCSNEDRYTALTDVIEAMQEVAPDMEFYIEIEGTSVLSNRTDALTASEQLEISALLVTVNTATQNNTELLHRLTTVHPSILKWDGIAVPEEEKSFVRTAETEKTES